MPAKIKEPNCKNRPFIVKSAQFDSRHSLAKAYYRSFLNLLRFPACRIAKMVCAEVL
jgi:hypothetical protein